MRRREFITLVGGSAVTWPLAAGAQQSGKLRRIGVLMNASAEDPLGQACSAAFAQGLQQLGWEVGRNVQIDYRWGGGDNERYRKYAIELIALSPDVILATANSIVGYLQQASRTVPIVFVTTIDPVGSGLVASLARPGGNATGFTNQEYGMSAKWLELLKQIAPRLTRVAVMRDPSLTSGTGLLAAIQAVAPSFGVELFPIDVRDPGQIERGIATFARGSNEGLIVASSPLAQIHRELIISLAARKGLPAVYPFRYFATSGGLITYGPNTIDPYRRAAGYVDRILKGEKPAELPVQAPTKFELVINLKTANALGLGIPTTLLASADEVIE